jgi:thioredoxin 1
MANPEDNKIRGPFGIYDVLPITWTIARHPLTFNRFWNPRQIADSSRYMVGGVLISVTLLASLMLFSHHARSQLREAGGLDVTDVLNIRPLGLILGLLLPMLDAAAVLIAACTHFVLSCVSRKHIDRYSAIAGCLYFCGFSFLTLSFALTTLVLSSTLTLFAIFNVALNQVVAVLVAVFLVLSASYLLFITMSIMFEWPRRLYEIGASRFYLILFLVAGNIAFVCQSLTERHAAYRAWLAAEQAAEQADRSAQEATVAAGRAQDAADAAMSALSKTSQYTADAHAAAAIAPAQMSSTLPATDLHKGNTEMRSSTPLERAGKGGSTRILVANDDSFPTEVLDSSLPVLVEFCAPWAVTCRAEAPLIQELAAKFVGQLKIVEVNVDVSVKTAARYGVRGVPTYIIFRGGAVEQQIVGAVPRSTLERRVRSVLRQ